jgi:8-oxo-dGTP diphosphatase
MQNAHVVAALIWNGDKFMICQRPAHKARGLLWEFVGGKVEPGETPEAALRRECREELAVEIRVDDLFMEVLHTYPDIEIVLSLYHAVIIAGAPQKIEHNDIRWITPAQIPDFDFCPADVEILERIRKEYGKRTGA